MTKLDEIRAQAEAAKELASKATQGPWQHELSWKRSDPTDKNWNWAQVFGPSVWSGEPSKEWFIDERSMYREDAEFIAASRTLVPDQAETILRLCKAIEKLREQRDFYIVKWLGEESPNVEHDFEKSENDSEIERILNPQEGTK